MSERGVVEAALYSAGKPLAAEDVARITGFSPESVREALEALSKAYDERGSAIEVARIGEKWTMQIRPEYGEKAHAFAPPEIPPDLLKTVALVAYYQPMKQSELVRMVGGKAYDHVRALRDLGLISANPLGQTLELKTTPSFPEVFGLPVTDREGIKRILAERSGVAPGAPEAPAPAEPKSEKHV